MDGPPSSVKIYAWAHNKSKSWALLDVGPQKWSYHLLLLNSSPKIYLVAMILFILLPQIYLLRQEYGFFFLLLNALIYYFHLAKLFLTQLGIY